MIISQKLLDTLNQQIANELGASNQYLQIAAYFDGEDLLQLAQVFFDQSDEERDHAMKLVHFVLEAGGELEIPDIPPLQHRFETAAEAVEAALNWEKEVTEQINNLMSIAVDDKDYISQNFLQWFVAEQLEEISKMGTILGIVKKAGGNMLMAEQVIMTSLPEEPNAGGEA